MASAGESMISITLCGKEIPVKRCMISQLELQFYTENPRILQELIDKPVGANDKQSDASEIICETIKAARSHLKDLGTLQCDAGEVLLETIKATRSHLRHLGAIARSTGYFTRN